MHISCDLKGLASLSAFSLKEGEGGGGVTYFCTLVQVHYANGSLTDFLISLMDISDTLTSRLLTLSVLSVIYRELSYLTSVSLSRKRALAH